MRWPFARYGTGVLVACSLIMAGATALAVWLLPWAAPIPALLLVFVLWFFRDPERVAPEGERKLLSPADGTVADVETVREDRFLGGEALRVGVFMSVFNVHVNRAPVSGTVAYRDYCPGKFLNAMAAEASRANECSFVGLEMLDGTRVLVRQIAGLIARRIVTACEVGDRLDRGERFGMVKFGSRLEVYVPAAAGFEASVKVGDKVSAGMTILGTIGEGAEA